MPERPARGPLCGVAPLVLVYLRTNVAAAILRDGFHQGHEGFYLTERSRGARGVYGAVPGAGHGRQGVLEIAVPDELFDKYEYDDPGRLEQAVIPARELASYPTRLLDEREVDTLTPPALALSERPRTPACDERELGYSERGRFGHQGNHGRCVVA